MRSTHPADDVRFGLLLSSHRDPGQSDSEVLARTVALAGQAEALGLDDIWVTEHHFVDSVVAPSSLTLAAYLLGSTSRIHVGTAVTLLPLHSPVHVAEQAALLDQVSGGRFTLGVGRGQPLVEYEVIGSGIDRWREGMPDALGLVLDSLRGEITGHTGLSVVPRPLTAAGPAVYLAANSQDSVHLAAVTGLPMLLYFDKDPEVKAEMIAEYQRFAGSGTTAPDHAFAVYAQVTDDPAEARSLMRDRACVMLGSAGRKRHLVPVTGTPLTGVRLEEMIDQVTDRLVRSHPVGDADTCVERLVHDIERSGCHRVLCQVEADGRTGSAERNLERLAGEVIPRVRRLVAASAPAGQCVVS
jgi:luciferase family oxidoreductase group 1